MRNFKIWNKMRNTTIMRAIAIALLLPNISPVIAQNDSEETWQFDVEVIIFKRELLPTNTENFEQEQFTLDESNTNNFLYFAALQDGQPYETLRSALPYCSTPYSSNNRLAASTNFEFNGKSGYKVNNQLPIELLASFEQLSQDILKDSYTANETLPKPASLYQLAVVEQKLLAIDKQAQRMSNTFSQISCDTKNKTKTQLSQFTLATIGPVLLNTSGKFTGHMQLLSEKQVSLQSYADTLFSQRDMKPLLHTAWRQNVKFGSENAEFVRVRAGKLLENKQRQSLADWGTFHTVSNVNTDSNEALSFNALKQDLKDAKDVDWLSNELLVQPQSTNVFVGEQQYEIEGKIKVYLDYVNQVPYLHIDNEFNHFALAIDEKGDSELLSFPLRQKRRVISKQIHYFDHPAFGVIVRLERFQQPVINDEATTN
jgi:hypothetical protein